MAFVLKKATKIDARLRLALLGPSGGGKSLTALKVAEILKGEGRIGAIDTERGSLSKYAPGEDGIVDNITKFDFDVIDDLKKYDPRILIEILNQLAETGYTVAIVDSLSHFWMGKGGELELVDAAVAKGGNSFTAWKNVSPIHARLVDTIVASPMHIICTMRTKQTWVIEEDDRGKKVPKKLGMESIMRDGIEYEFDVCGQFDQNHAMTITKTRCAELGEIPPISCPGAEFALTLQNWLRGAKLPATTTLVPETLPLDANQGSKEDAMARSQFEKMIEEFQKLKPVIGVEQYYKILRQYGYKHSNDFRSMDKARECYQDMKVAATVNGQVEGKQ